MVIETYYLPRTVLGSRTIPLSWTDKVPALVVLTILLSKTGKLVNRLIQDLKVLQKNGNDRE